MGGWVGEVLICLGSDPVEHSLLALPLPCTPDRESGVYSALSCSGLKKRLMAELWNSGGTNGRKTLPTAKASRR